MKRVMTKPLGVGSKGGRWCERYALPLGFQPDHEVREDTPRDPPNGIHRLRDGLDWDAIEAENAMYAKELARQKRRRKK